MTDVLQVMDLVVNSPLKAGMRKGRCEDLFNHFQNFKIEVLKAEAEGRPPPNWSPPKPTMPQGLKLVRQVIDTTFETAKFQESLSKCFVDVCLAPKYVDEECAVYNVYRDHKHGKMNKSLFGEIKTLDDADTSLGEIANDIDLVPRNEADEEDLDEELDAEDSEDDCIFLVPFHGFSTHSWLSVHMHLPTARYGAHVTNAHSFSTRNSPHHLITSIVM
jgi:hypothetical protein